jgi:tRNA-specific 2-thiouridylase
MMTRTVVAMSGGVDSSVAALLCVRAGHEVIGMTMQIWPDASPDALEREGGCCSLGAVEDARRVCSALGIPHYVTNLKQAFEDEVIDEFIREYALGRTPNPCITCNKAVKFGHLLRRARELEADYLATGHYARVGRSETGRCLLMKAPDESKDQSYALYSLDQAQLAHALFPVGSFAKHEVRRLAREARLPTFARPESQDICFITSGDYRDFLRHRRPEAFRPGPIEDVTGRVVGSHAGIAHFTVGQRRGLGIASGRPMYILDIRPGTNTIVVGPWEESLHDGFFAGDCNWIEFDRPVGPFRADTKIRYRSSPAPALITPHQAGDRVEVRFDRPQRAVTPGQAAVFYHGDIVAGGGTIFSAFK